MTPASIRMRRGAAFATATLAVACVFASQAVALQHPEAASVPTEGPGSPLREGNRLVTEVRFEHGALASLDDLRAAGARVLDASRRYQTVTVAARPRQLRALDGIEGVGSVSTVPTPITYGTCGSVNSEGDTQLAAAEARADFGVDGTGVTVGILSDSFDTDASAATHAAQDVASGDLPGNGNPCGFAGPVSLLSDTFTSKSTDEGRGMAQIVHDLAPGAKLLFATAFEGEIAFAESIRDLAAAGASVIIDDVAYSEEPFFQDGPVAVAINDVVGKGVTYFTAAGNDNLISAGKDFASWETPKFRDSAGCPAALEALPPFEPDHCLDFDPGAGEDDTFGITVEKEDALTVNIQWAEPWYGVKSDIDAYLLDKSGNLLASSTMNNLAKPGSADCDQFSPSLRLRCQRPVEIVDWENEGAETEVKLAIDRCFGAVCNPGADPAAEPRIKLALNQNGRGVKATEYLESNGEDLVGPTVYGHSGAAAAVTLGAIRAGVTTKPEPYSSRGPVKHYFGPVATAPPAVALPSPALERTIPKPDVVATDGGRTTFFLPYSPEPGIFRFFGTSAAAPHAAAVAALARQANPALTPAQIQTGLAETALPVGTFGPNAVGAGLIDAHSMLEDVALPPAITIVNPPKAISNNRSPSIGFSANRPVSFACLLDGEALPCTSPFSPPVPLADGPHGFAVRGEDLAGKVGFSQLVSFTVDTVAPRTSFRRHPRKTLRTRRRKAKAVFELASNEPGSQFTCRVDGGLVRFCPDRFVRRFGPGRHMLRAMAVDVAGNVDETPATFRFKVKRVGAGSSGR